MTVVGPGSTFTRSRVSLNSSHAHDLASPCVAPVHCRQANQGTIFLLAGSAPLGFASWIPLFLLLLLFAWPCPFHQIEFHFSCELFKFALFFVCVCVWLFVWFHYAWAWDHLQFNDGTPLACVGHHYCHHGLFCCCLNHTHTSPGNARLLA